MIVTDEQIKYGLIAPMKLKLIFGILAISIVAYSCKKDNASNSEDVASQINKFPIETLSNSEKQAILFIREEEKLAHDVYVTLFNKWKVNIFENIASSEQVHSNAVSTLIQRYGLIDPVGSNGVGIFHDTILQKLYDTLIQVGFQSELMSYHIGAEIEELDIADIMNMELISDNQDLNFVLSNLKKGSRNHLRSFNEKIISAGSSYSPKHIGLSLFNDIINSPRETGGW